jgi:hypothetical protein
MVKLEKKKARKVNKDQKVKDQIKKTGIDTHLGQPMSLGLFNFL